jgi:hypothetical protein
MRLIINYSVIEADERDFLSAVKSRVYIDGLALPVHGDRGRWWVIEELKTNQDQDH